MPGNADMERREAFLRAYQAGVLDGVALPASLRENYHLCACLKDGERQVYLLQDRDGSPAVLKTQPTGREDSLRAEYDLLGKLRHPQIPRPLAYLEEGDREYLVREYVEGSSLAELVEAQGALSPERTRAAVVSLCRVLEHLHSQEPPVICRDIKPQNVVMDKEGPAATARNRRRTRCSWVPGPPPRRSSSAISRRTSARTFTAWGC